MRASQFIQSAIISLCTIVTGAKAQEKSSMELYQACLQKTEFSPKDAFEDAIQWRGEGGGNPAIHCAASALMALGLYAEAAKRLEALAQSVKGSPKLKARVLEQAVLAWLSASNPLRAEATATSALALTPKNPSLLISRARARAELGDYLAAKKDLDITLQVVPNHATALAFRAAALRYLDKRVAALADVNAALEKNPNHPEALLERGILKRLVDDKMGARSDWLKILELAPKTGAASIARENLEKMDLRNQ